MKLTEAEFGNGASKKPIRSFISYSHLDAKDAAKIANDLQGFDIDAFISHNSIPCGKRWRDIIVREIKERECFIPLISKNYHVACYTEQEFGMAMAMNKNIFPISLDKTIPGGFGEEYQCKLLSPTNTEYVDLVKEIRDGLPEGKKYLDWLVDKLCNAQSYEEANRFAEKIDPYLEFTKTQISCMQEALEYNDQVSNAFTAKRVVHNILQKNR